MAGSISSSHCSSCIAVAASSDSVSSISWVQLAVFYDKLSSSIGSTTSWPIIRQKGEHPVVHPKFIALAQSTAGSWWTHISFGLSEQVVSVDSASAIGLCPHLITPIAAA